MNALLKPHLIKFLRFLRSAGMDGEREIQEGCSRQQKLLDKVSFKKILVRFRDVRIAFQTRSSLNKGMACTEFLKWENGPDIITKFPSNGTNVSFFGLETIAE